MIFEETLLKNNVEEYLTKKNISYNTINEPNHLFHFVVKRESFGIPIEIFQEKNTLDLTIGFMTFLSNELNFKIYKFSKDEKEEFKKKVDEFLSTIRVDYRTGVRVGYEIISEKGHYGAKYFIKSKKSDYNKEKITKMLEIVKDTAKKSKEFLNMNLKNKFATLD